MKKIFYAICMIALISSPVFAQDSDDSAHTITCLDTTGGGPGVQSVQISNHSTASYSGADGAGGLGGGTDDGQVMAVITGSVKPNADIALYFGVRSSNAPTIPDDNNIYQLHPNAVITSGDCAQYLATDISGWAIRGGS